MKKLTFLFFLFCLSINSFGQNSADTSNGKQIEASADDPSQFITRVELFSELQHHKIGSSYFNLNQTTLRTVVKMRKRFTTRLDVPFVYNSFSSAADDQQFGLGDISFRVLGYRFLESSKSAVTASIEISLNTAESSLLGTGKNIILPVISYTTSFREKRILLAFVFQEAISFSGDETRDEISYTKLQPILLKTWSRRLWTVLAPELYLDYVHGGASMNLEGRISYAPVRRINIWAQVGAGLFGDFIARYQWGVEAGCRYFFLRNTFFERKKAQDKFR